MFPRHHGSPSQEKQFLGCRSGSLVILATLTLWGTGISSSILGVVGGLVTKQMNVQPEAGSL